MEEEHEVYGGDIPEEAEGDIEVGLDGEPEDLKVDDTVTDEAASKELEETKKRLKERRKRLLHYGTCKLKSKGR